MKITYETKLMVGRTKSNKNKYWRGRVLSNENGEVFYETHSWTGENGKLKTSGLVRIKRKNVGKKNETTEQEQGELEIESVLRKKIDEGYEYYDGTPIEGERFVLPMLADVFDDKSNVEFPAYLQFKYEGVRCCHKNEKHWSRKGKVYTTASHCYFDTKGLIVDGELMLPYPYTFQQTLSAVKRDQPLSKELIHVIYDCYDANNPDMPFKDRYELLKTLELPPNVKLAPTEIAANSADIYEFHKKATAQNFEGTMIRNPEGKYLIGLKRSRDLLKLKDFFEGEFKIVHYTEGNGACAGQVIFECLSEDGLNKFNVMMAASHEERRQMFIDGEKYIGKMLTVKYQRKTDNGTPYLGTGVAIRDYE